LAHCSPYTFLHVPEVFGSQEHEVEKEGGEYEEMKDIYYAAYIKIAIAWYWRV